MITEPTTDAPTITPIQGPTDLMRARRTGRRLWAVVRTAVVTLVVLGVVTLVCPGLFGAWSVRAGDAVPRSIQLPWRWQASVEDAPPGPAAVVATGDQPTPPSEAPVAEAAGAAAVASPVQVVGRNGVYRALYPPGQWAAGEDIHLSPDGRYLALPYLDDPGTASRGPTLVDLTTGRARVLTISGPGRDGLKILGWRPDGGALLVATITGATAQVALLNRTTRGLTTLAQLPAQSEEHPWRFAFSPDGTRVVFSVAGTLRLVDDRGALLWTVSLPDGHVLAGGGAFTLDSRRIALVHAVPCQNPCGGARAWVVTYVDSTDGSAVPGPALPTIMAAQVRAVGWSPDRGPVRGGLVVVRHLPRPPAPPTYAGPTGGGAATTAPHPTPATPAEVVPGPADLYELIPGEPPRLLLDAPYEVTNLDVAAELVAAGRLEGAPSTPSLLPIKVDRVRPVDVALSLAVLGGLAAVVAAAAAGASRRPPAAVRPRRR